MSENKDVLDDLRALRDAPVRGGRSWLADEIMDRAISEIEKLRAAMGEIHRIASRELAEPSTNDTSALVSICDLAEGTEVSAALEIPALDRDLRLRGEAAESLMGELAEARELLKSLEWTGHDPRCPSCGKYKPWASEEGKTSGGHGPDCRLAAFLLRREAKP